MRRKTSLYMKDIIAAIDKIQEFTQGMSFEEFLEDDKTSSAVIRKIEIIGEAAKQLPRDILNRFPEIPWSSMAKMRDKIIHFYHGVDYQIVWEVIKHDLPPLKPSAERILRILREEEGKIK